MADHNHLIASKLTQQVSCLESIAALLDDELTAIASKRGEGLKEIAQQKISLLQKIQTLDKEVQVLVSKNDAQDEDVSSLITQVNELLTNCKKKNDVNAHAAHQAQLSVKQLKDILIGAPSSMTYDQGGSVIQGENKIVHNLKA
ncbi:MULTISPECIES: flagellar protein FlgN [unclassified Pseudoalteromonas]|jgi:flagella synthesis protein FlgN|uniref:flagellar protein FlgN n=1 Tax=unclassified Pseudoalteromonas TaxID=194690 RepID=UPI00102323C0|nr:flagellar protein FlgN [Pseudoalteromonas sp. L1]RZF93009.1 flagellar protein FlgN [Pseudoalteromonas sp. CO302Y]RZG09844.1 flagellar protein FlgN [Pseudoalteromonas sp. CO133X]WOC25367.1 flagellar protein FlgN [Pseudoalteromonas sp. N1230-9]